MVGSLQGKGARGECFALIRSHFTVLLVYELHRLSLLRDLEAPSKVVDIAARYGCSVAPLRDVLRFLAGDRGVLTYTPPDTFCLAPSFLPLAVFEMHLEKFVGAYGGTFSNLECLFRGDRSRVTPRDDEKLAASFHRYNSIPRHGNPVVDVLMAGNPRLVVDLGCGDGNLLLEACARAPLMRGIGVDQSLDMCAYARANIAARNLADRVEIVHSEIGYFLDQIDVATKSAVTDVVGCSILNEFFGEPAAAEQFLRRVRSAFPGRRFYVVDYYGSLSGNSWVDDSDHTVLQDIVQLLSGQGVPPSNLQDWAAIYQAAECKCVHAYEGTSAGIRWFIHVLSLQNTCEPEPAASPYRQT
jgi:SAM-dependent methyltransferase